MPKAEWGTKHSCTACQAKFYDFNRSPPYCPRCGTVVTMEGDNPPPDPPEDDIVHDAGDADADATLETDDDVESEEHPEIED